MLAIKDPKLLRYFMATVLVCCCLALLLTFAGASGWPTTVVLLLGLALMALLNVADVLKRRRRQTRTEQPR